MTRTVALVVFGSLFSFASVASAQAPIPVFVTSAGAANGFTDPSKGNLDTVKDLRKSLSDYKADVRLVERAEEAQIVLTVLGREVGPTVNDDILGTSSTTFTVRVRFQAGAVDTELTAVAPATFGSAWSKGAGKIAKQVRDWIVANRAQLAAPK